MQQNKTVSQQKTINPVYWVPTAYFAMGLPFIAINLVSVFMFKDLGISDTQIAFWTSLIMMPWTLKFLWSPFLEMYRTKKFFVLVTELLSGILFGIVAFSLFFDYFFAISISTMAVIAFSGATHDIACDGVYMAELNKEEQAKYIGVQGAFYNVVFICFNRNCHRIPRSGEYPCRNSCLICPDSTAGCHPRCPGKAHRRYRPHFHKVRYSAPPAGAGLPY